MSGNFTDIIDFTLVYNLHKRQLYNYVSKMLNDRFTAEDITQTVFLKLFENLDNIREKGSVLSWLFVTARNEVYSYLRKKHVRSENCLDEDAGYASKYNLNENVENEELKKIIKNEVNLLADDLKEAFVLREYSELSYKEISSLLDVEESVVKGRLFRARQKLIDKVSKLVR